MKQMFKSLLIILTLCCFTPYTVSASTYASRLGTKMGTGIVNAATGVAEIPKTIVVTNRLHGPAYAATAGFLTGLFHMMGRTLSGVGDLVTFVVPTKPIVQPNYVWENWDKETSYRKTWELLP
ncbi:MAG: exosortase system-associated protein, TIGR04073 family [Methylococcaceae bacterium]